MKNERPERMTTTKDALPRYLFHDLKTDPRGLRRLYNDYVEYMLAAEYRITDYYDFDRARECASAFLIKKNGKLIRTCTV